MKISNEDVRAITVRQPEGHKHLRTTVTLADGTELVFAEATVSNILRAFIGVKTHPVKKSVTLVGREVTDGLKPGYARWQLLEQGEDDGEI